MFKFDLERALAGDELITRQGEIVSAPFVALGENVIHSYQEGYTHSLGGNIYTSDGSYFNQGHGGRGNHKDLFMKCEEEPSNFTPRGGVTMTQKTHLADLIDGKLEFTRLQTGAPSIKLIECKHLEINYDCSPFDLDYVLVNGVKFSANNNR